MHPWHTLSTGQVLEQLRADPVSGLAVNEAAQRLQHWSSSWSTPASPSPKSPAPNVPWTPSGR